MKTKKLITSLALCSLTLAGCGSVDESSPTVAAEAMATEAPPAATAAAMPDQVAPRTFSPAVVEMWEACSLCHGDLGLGDGIVAPSLGVPIPSLADAAWQASITDEDLGAIIIDGGAAHGKSLLMPPHPQLTNSPALLEGILAKVRSLGPAGQ